MLSDGEKRDLIAEAEQHYAELNGLDSRAAEVLMQCAQVLKSSLPLVAAPTEEQIERGGSILFQHWEVGKESVLGDLVRAALTAAVGVAPQAHAKPVDTSAERVNSGADSSHVAPQEPSGENVSGTMTAEEAVDHVLRRPELYGLRREPVPSPDNEKRGINLMRDLGYDETSSEVIEARAVASRYDRENLVADALAAQPVLDERKVAEVIWERATQKTSMGFFIFNPDGAHKIARALCEAAKRGELT